MRYYFVLGFSLLISQVLSQNKDNFCVCVPFYLCVNGTILTTGDGIIDERLGEESTGKCNDVTHICCKPPDQATIRNPDPETPPQKCGEHKPDGIRYKITLDPINNNEALFGEFPWMVGVLLANGSYRCGGSLIHPSVVLTAAHCVRVAADYEVVAGEWDSSSDQEHLKKQTRKVATIKSHEDYKHRIYYNDIALLFLETPFELKAHIQPVCLPPPSRVPNDKECFVTGWGKTKFGKNGTVPAILKKVELGVVPKDRCQENLRKTRLGPYYKLDDSFVCAGGEEGRDACIGDGGGPLVCPIVGEENRYRQVGIVSWGIGCGEENVPGVYADVAFLRDWVDKQIKDKNYNTSSYEF